MAAQVSRAAAQWWWFAQLWCWTSDAWTCLKLLDPAVVEDRCLDESGGPVSLSCSKQQPTLDCCAFHGRLPSTCTVIWPIDRLVSGARGLRRVLLQQIQSNFPDPYPDEGLAQIVAEIWKQRMWNISRQISKHIKQYWKRFCENSIGKLGITQTW